MPCIDLLVLREETVSEVTGEKKNRTFNFGVSFLVPLMEYNLEIGKIRL